MNEEKKTVGLDEKNDNSAYCKALVKLVSSIDSLLLVEERKEEDCQRMTVRLRLNCGLVD